MLDWDTVGWRLAEARADQVPVAFKRRGWEKLGLRGRTGRFFRRRAALGGYLPPPPPRRVRLVAAHRRWLKKGPTAARW